jgi:hypothetical protein
MKYISSLFLELGNYFSGNFSLLCYKIALFFDSENNYALFNLWLHYKFHLEWEKSHQYFLKAYNLDNQSPETIWNLWITFTALGDLANAFLMWFKYTENDIFLPENKEKYTDIWFALGRYFWEDITEVIYWTRLDCARIQVKCIPYNDSLNYDDVLLIDWCPEWSRIINEVKYEIFPVIQILEKSSYVKICVNQNEVNFELSQSLEQKFWIISEMTSKNLNYCAECSIWDIDYTDKVCSHQSSESDKQILYTAKNQDTLNDFLEKIYIR